MIQAEGVLNTLAYGGSAGMGLGFAFLVVRWFATFIGGRIDQKEAHLDNATRALMEGLRGEITRLADAEKELRAEFMSYRRETDKQLRECERKHSQSEAEVARLKAIMQGYGEAREKAQLIVASERKERKA